MFAKFPILFALLLLNASVAATTIVETSSTHEFFGAVINSSGETAYFARPIIAPGNNTNLVSIHRDGAEWVSANGAYEKIDDSKLVITDLGVVLFGADQGEFTLNFPAGPALNYIGGVYRGPSPQTPTIVRPYLDGDSVYASAQGAGTPVAFGGGDLIFKTGSGLLVRAPFAPCSNSDQIVTGISIFSGNQGGRPGELSAANNQRFLASVVAAAGNGFANDKQLILGRYFDFCPGDPGSERFSALAENTAGYFRSVSDISLDDSKIITVIASRNASGPASAGVYRISSGGDITAVRETVPNDPTGWRPEALSRSGQYLFSLTDSEGQSELFFSGNPSQPVIGPGHLLDGWVIDCSVDVGGVSDTGQVVCTGEVCRLDDPDDCKNAVLVADGGTDFPPDPDEPPEPPANLVLWSSSSDGSFFDAQNWNPMTVPDSDQVAVFAPDAAVAVSFGSQVASTERLFIERGPVIFDGGSYQLNSGSNASPSLVLRAGTPGDLASLWIQGGHQLQTTGALLDQGASVGSTLNGVIIEDSLSTVSPQSRWENTGRLVVDASLSISWSGGLVSDSLRVASTPGSTGAVSVGPTPQSGLACPDISIADFGEVSIAYAGTATMMVERDCTVEATGDRVIGELAGSDGDVTFFRSSWIRFYTSGPSTRLTVGRRGSGLLSVLGGSSVIGSDIVVGQLAGSNGTVSVQRNAEPFSFLGAEALLVIGAAGQGELFADDGGRIEARQLSVASFPGSDGRIRLAGSPADRQNLDVAEVAVIGESGIGHLTIESAAQMRSGSGVVGGSSGGSGFVQIGSGGAWDVDSSLEIGRGTPGSDPLVCEDDEIAIATAKVTLLGDGQIADITGESLTVSGPGSRLSGNGVVSFSNTSALHCAVLAPGTSPGTLTIDGDLELTGGVLEIEIFGLNDGQFDVLKVTGDASVSGSVVRFIFNGYLPQTGDQVAFLETNGTTTLGNEMRYEYQGVNDGFEFDVEVNAQGDLAFVAINDGVSDFVFRDGFE